MRAHAHGFMCDCVLPQGWQGPTLSGATTGPAPLSFLPMAVNPHVALSFSCPFHRFELAELLDSSPAEITASLQKAAYLKALMRAKLLASSMRFAATASFTHGEECAHAHSGEEGVGHPLGSEAGRQGDPSLAPSRSPSVTSVASSAHSRARNR